MTHLNSGVLQIYPVHAGDSGRYRCRGSNVAGMRLGSEIRVIITPGKLPAQLLFEPVELLRLCKMAC